MGWRLRGRGRGRRPGCGTFRGRSRSSSRDCGTTATLPITMPALSGKKKGNKKKEPWECSCAVDLPFKKVRGDNKYPNDSSVPAHSRLKLTRGPNVECQQQTQRSEQWGAEAASTAWLNGAGDFPSPPLPSRHSQSLLGKSGAPACKPGSQSGRAGEGSWSLSGTMHYSHAPLRH